MTQPAHLGTSSSEHNDITPSSLPSSSEYDFSLLVAVPGTVLMILLVLTPPTILLVATLLVLLAVVPTALLKALSLLLILLSSLEVIPICKEKD